MAEDFDIGPLTWVKDEINLSLKNVLDNLNAVQENKDNLSPLKFSQTYLYQVTGALDMVGLQGCKRLSQELGILSECLQKSEIQPTEQTIDLMREAIATLNSYLSALLNGAQDQPLVLFTAIQKLCELQNKQIEESELFFPDTSIRAPKDVLKDQSDVALDKSFYAVQRSVFQQNLLEWLKNPNQASANAMAVAMHEVQLRQIKPVQKTLLWVSSAFLETLGQPQIAAKPGAKKVCRRLDQYLRNAELESSKSNDALMRDLLYYVALSAPSNALITAVKETFELEGTLPNKALASMINRVVNDEARDAVQTLLYIVDALKISWAKIAEEDTAEFVSFDQKLAQSSAIMPTLDDIYIADLLTQVQLVTANHLAPNEFLQLEVATALNQVEEALQSFGHYHPNHLIKMEEQANRLQRLSKGETLDTQFGDTTQIQNNDALSAVAKEVKSLLHLAETSLDTFFRNPSEVSVLNNAATALNKAIATFDVLDLSLAGDITRSAVQLMARFNEKTDEKLFSEVAEALSMLEFYIDEMPRVRIETTEILTSKLAVLNTYTENNLSTNIVNSAVAEVNDIELAAEKTLENIPNSAQEHIAFININETVISANIDNLDSLNTADFAQNITDSPINGIAKSDELTTELATAKPNNALVIDRSSEAELLDIFLEEAEEVAANIAKGLKTLRINATDKLALGDVRRGFHTLKGSGRTIGLKEMGEAAWAIERLHNTLMERDLVPTMQHLDFIEAANAAFAGWISQLSQLGFAELTAKPWQAEADTLIAAIIAPQENPTKPVTEEVVIGGTKKVSKKLFEIFMQEAMQHLYTLQEAQALLYVSNEQKPSDESRRAAHTLASNAGSTGFESIKNLARTFEYWLDAHRGIWTEMTIDLHGNVVNALADMLQKARNYEVAKAATGLIAALKQATIHAADPQNLDVADVATETEALDDAASNVIDFERHEVSLMHAESAAVTESMLDNGLDQPEQVDESSDSAVDASLQNSSLEAFNINDLALPSLEFVNADLPDEALLSSDLASVDIKNADLISVDSSNSLVSDLPLEQAQVKLLDAPKPYSIDEVVAAKAQLPTKKSPQAKAKKIRVTTQPAAMTVDQELLTMFMLEANDLVPQIGNELRAWRNNPAELEHPDNLLRALHTLKGSARMAGQGALGDTVHGMEDRVMRAQKNKLTPISFDEIFVDLDHIGGLLEQATKTDDDIDADESSEQTTKVTTTPIARSADRSSQYLRLRADTLDRLINEAGEISIARSRMDREMLGFKQFSSDLTESITRLRGHLREIEIEAESQLQSRLTLLQETQDSFDPLEFDRFTRLQELTRMMAESVNDVSTIQLSVLSNLDETEAALQQQNRMNRELQRGLMNVRMVPFSLIAERLQRIVRQTSRELNKAVNVVFDGVETEIDRSVLDKIGAPLEHLLRNSVAHGLESEANRIAAGKQTSGQVTLKVRQENDEIILTVSDDGAGIDLERVKEKAIAVGLLQSDQLVTEQTLLSVIFEPGFSTATTVTQIAGRGVGLDAVRTDITSLGGRIDVANMPHQGAVFTIYLPVSLSIAQVVMVRSGAQMFAVPSVMVEQLQSLKVGVLTAAYENKTLDWAGRQYPIHYLSMLVGDYNSVAEPQPYTPVLLLRSGSYRVALHIDEILGNQEVVMKPIGAQLTRVPGILGATVLGDGNITLIINPVQLANREILAAGSVRLQAATMPVIEQKTVVMVVDDSLTIRKVIGRLLEREGFQVITAKDGLDGIQKLQEFIPDVILTDIEMPRMDGFEFSRNVRDDIRTAKVPLIMISSRTADKHQSLAKEIGVDFFFGKPVPDDELILKIHELVKK